MGDNRDHSYDSRVLGTRAGRGHQGAGASSSTGRGTGTLGALGAPRAAGVLSRPGAPGPPSPAGSWASPRWVLLQPAPLALGGDNETLHHPLFVDVLRQLGTGSCRSGRRAAGAGSPLAGDPVLGATYPLELPRLPRIALPAPRSTSRRCVHLGDPRPGILLVLPAAWACGPWVALVASALAVTNPAFVYVARSWINWWGGDRVVAVAPRRGDPRGRDERPSRGVWTRRRRARSTGVCRLSAVRAPLRPARARHRPRRLARAVADAARRRRASSSVERSAYRGAAAPSRPRDGGGVDAPRARRRGAARGARRRAPSRRRRGVDVVARNRRRSGASPCKLAPAAFVLARRSGAIDRRREHPARSWLPCCVARRESRQRAVVARAATAIALPLFGFFARARCKFFYLVRRSSCTCSAAIGPRPRDGAAIPRARAASSGAVALAPRCVFFVQTAALIDAAAVQPRRIHAAAPDVTGRRDRDGRRSLDRARRERRHASSDGHELRRALGGAVGLRRRTVAALARVRGAGQRGGGNGARR